MSGLSAARVKVLRPLLEAFVAAAPQRDRIAFDPVQFPRRYADPRDMEVSGLLAAALAYGRVDLFAPKVNALLAQMGGSPADFVRELDVEAARDLLQGFVYRFNVGTDVAVLLLGAGKVLREEGSLEAMFLRHLGRTGTWHAALSGFLGSLRDIPMGRLTRAMGPPRGLQHLLPHPLGAGAAKRLNLFLRWMIRGPDEVDLGIWRACAPAQLVIPLDTHIARIALRIGLTRRRDLSWKTAEEVTASLRGVDAVDPVRFDFALCHHGMSGICAVTPRAEPCAGCLLLPACRTGRRFSPT